MTTAYQYKIRKEKELEEKEDLGFDPSLLSLKNSSIRKIDRETARKIIVEYEWLKKMPMIVNYCFGLYFNIDNKEVLGGVVVFSEEYAINTGVWENRYKFENKIILLSRGVCLWWTPKNSASYFISKACKWIKENTEYRVITATVDPSAGEIGTIYQSLNWDYVGLMSGNGNNKRTAYMIDGVKKTSRWMRNTIGTMKWDEVQKHYPTAIKINDERKRRYFYFLDKKYRKEIEHLILEYPKRDSQPTVGVIYRLTNTINNKVYIGQTLRAAAERFYDYERDKTHNEYLRNSMKKYGMENFKREIIFEAKSVDELNEKEVYFIKLHNSTNREFGYNLEIGGRNALLSDSTKLKMSEARKGKKQTKEWVEKRIPKKGTPEALKHGRPKSEEEKKYLSENTPKYWLGKERDEETKKKISETKLKNGPSEKQIDSYYKTVLVIDPITKEILDEQISTGECGKKYGIHQGNISRRCNGILKNKGDYYFIYKGDYEKGETEILYPENIVSDKKKAQLEKREQQKKLRLEKEEELKKQKQNTPRKKVVQSEEWVQKRINSVANKVYYLDRENNEILEEYYSLASAGKENPRNDSEQRIGRICRGEISEANNNLIYCYSNDYENNTLPTYKSDVLKKFSELSNEELDEALTKYNNGQSIRSIANDLNTHFGNINSYLKDKTSDNIEMFPYDNFNVLKCVETGKLIDDVHNKSGGVLKHLKSIYPDLVVESNYKRKQIEKETGKYWYHDYFEFENINKDFEVKKCHYCDWVTKDINNESGAYEKHLKVAHDISLNRYVEENPKDRLYFKKEIYDELVECGVCGDEFKILNHTHLKTHDMSVVDYKLEYGSDNMVSKESSQKLKDGYDKYLKFQPFKKSSSLEETIINAIPEIDFEVSNRTILDGMEIDLYCKEKNIGIEVNGCLYHTEIFGKKDRNYHLNKTKGCLEKDIKLIHIFEDEVSNPLVINKIKNILGIDKSERIYARNTTVVKIEESFIKNEFMNKHHIQGKDRSDIAYGAYYNDNLIAVMCFNNKRQMNKSNTHDENTYELTRFATHTDYNIAGVASKLLKRFIDENNPKKIISFADIRWTPNKDNMYQRIGFELVKTLKPDYMYYNPKISRYKRHHKFGFGKSQLKNKYPDIYSDDKTEWQMMQEKGFDRIWDCGKYRYEMNFN